MPQVKFNRINANAPTHTLDDDELQTSLNIDYSVAQGALVSRRGCLMHGTVSPTRKLQTIFRNYNLPDNIDGNKFYVSDDQGAVFRGSAGSWTTISTGGNTNLSGMASYGTYAIIASGTSILKDDGTTTTDWIKQSPSAPSITVNTLAALDLTFGTATFAVTESGTSSSPGGTATADTSADNRITFTLDFGGAKDLTTNAGQTIGDFGVHFVDLAFDDPTLVVKISQDYSIGNANFHDYWHAEINPQNDAIVDAFSDPNVLIDAQLNVNSSQAISQSDRERMISAIRDNNNSSAAAITRISNVLSAWATSRPDFLFIGSVPNVAGTDPWSSIYAIRYTIECTALTTATIRTPSVGGAQNYPLKDLNTGYAWWNTYATFDADNNKIGESAAGPASSRVRCQNSNVTVVQAGTATGAHGITHMITYRQGGYTRQPYAVATSVYGTFTVTDTINDIQALSLNYSMEPNVIPKSKFSGNIVTISEPFQKRVFVGETNRIRWSLPDRFDSFLRTNVASISNIGDNVKAIIPWPPGLVVVNQYSVFEVSGNDFESGDYIISRSGAKHGSIAPKVAIKTPHGIPLLSYDGLTMYVPGQGTDVEIPWLMAHYGDMFKGGANTDPAYTKGNRIPALNYGYLNLASATYTDGKLYLAAPTGSATTPNTVYVIDFNTQRVWWYEYAFHITSLYWDHQNSRLLAGTTDGRLMQLETGVIDQTTAGSPITVPWSARTKSWNVVSESVLENVFVEYKGTGPIIAQVSYDGGGTYTSIGTLSSTVRTWANLPMSGTFNNNIEFQFLGQPATNTDAVLYQLHFDLLSEPPRVRYYRTPYETGGAESDKLWDVAYHDVSARYSGTGTATLTAVTFIDGVAVATHTITRTNTGRSISIASLPAETYGRVAHTTFTSTSTAVEFQVFGAKFDARVEPPRVNYAKSDIESLEEHICDAFDVDINPNGTVTAICYVDGAPVSTNTILGIGRLSQSISLPVEQYGRQIYMTHAGSGFKLYKTWFHLRAEPDRWIDYVTTKQSGDEHEWKVWKPELDCLGGTCTGTLYVDNNIVSITAFTGSRRQQYVSSVPIVVFGRSIWAAYHSASRFKHYSTEYEGQKEPARITLWREGPVALPSPSHIKTWLPMLDPLGGNVVGTLYLGGTAISTQTFSGAGKQIYNVGIDLDGSNWIREGTQWEARYTGTGSFKHYVTEVETEPFPFSKRTWAYSYKKLGGVSQVDLARFWNCHYRGNATTTATYYWDIDNVNFTSGTLVMTASEGFADRIPFPPGARGQLFEFRLSAPVPVQIDSLGLDVMQEGVKGLTRREVKGTPQDR